MKRTFSSLLMLMVVLVTAHSKTAAANLRFFKAIQQKQSLTLRGRVVDARTGEPMSKVKVIANQINEETITDDTGAFILANVTPGKIDLYITTVTGSGFPVPGFFRQVGQSYFLSNERNQTRIPYYSRVDVRVSKAFTFRNWKLTVNGEVLNLLNRNKRAV